MNNMLNKEQKLSLLQSKIYTFKMPNWHLECEKRSEYQINESTRSQLDAISTVLAGLQSEHHRRPKRKPIGFIQPKEDEE